VNETRTLSRFASEMQYEDLSPEAVAKTKGLILDQLGVELATSNKPWSLGIYRSSASSGGNPESTVVYFGDRLPVMSAAFINACFGHGFEIDDIYPPGHSHPGTVIIPAAMALGEREGINGKRLILAVATGYEVMGRVGMGTAPSILAAGHHPTAGAGPFGAAAVGAKILNFDAELMLNALGIAGITSCGLGEFNQTGGSVKKILGGLAATGGLRAAFLAKEGITGPPTILEGDRGYLKAFSNENKAHVVTADLGKRWVVMDTGYKIHANCAGNHGPIDSLMKVKAEHPFEANDVEEIVGLHNSMSLKMIGTIRDPQTVPDAQFSGAFNLAMNVVLGSNSFAHYTDEVLKNQEIRELAKKVRFEVDPEADAKFPHKRIAGVIIKLKNGAVYTQKTEGAKGLPQNPLTDTEVRDKFRDLACVAVPKPRAEAIIKTIDSMETLGDISELVKLLVK
jgi:2-methylcitrate dehydratase PrpD